MSAPPVDVPRSTASPAAPPPVKTEECHLWEFAPPDDPEGGAGWKQQIPVDSGPREHASGAVTRNDAGIPVVYVVAPDDWPIAIGERFCVNLACLNVLNGVRRQGALSLWAGDTLTLDAHTILTIGDQRRGSKGSGSARSDLAGATLPVVLLGGAQLRWPGSPGRQRERSQVFSRGNRRQDAIHGRA